MKVLYNLFLVGFICVSSYVYTLDCWCNLYVWSLDFSVMVDGHVYSRLQYKVNHNCISPHSFKFLNHSCGLIATYISYPNIVSFSSKMIKKSGDAKAINIFRPVQSRDLFASI